MPKNRTLRHIALVGLAALLIATGCNRGDDDDADIEATDAPSPTPAVETIADFQIVGRIDESLVGQDPPVDVSDADLEAPDDDDASPTPEPTPIGEPAPEGGVMRIEAEAVNEDLRTNCGVEPDEFVNVYWTTGTYFEPASILDDFDDLEDRIEERTAGATGVIVQAPGVADDDDALETLEPTAAATADASPDVSPDASPDADDTVDADCILIAEQVGFTSPSIATPRPAVRTAAPAPVRTPTPAPRTATPAPTRTATPEPDETDEPTDAPTTSPAS